MMKTPERHVVYPIYEYEYIYIYAVKPCNFIPPVECKISSKELMWT